MPSNYRPYQPEQSYLLPPSPSDWLPEKHLAFFISRSGGRDGSERVVRATRRERSAGEPALSPSDDAQDPDLWVCDGNVLVAKDRAEDRRGRGVPSAGSGELSAASDDLRLSAGAPSEVRRAVQASRSDRQEQRSDQAGPCGHRRNEGQSERQPA